MLWLHVYTGMYPLEVYMYVQKYIPIKSLDAQLVHACIYTTQPLYEFYMTV